MLKHIQISLFTIRQFQVSAIVLPLEIVDILIGNPPLN